MKVDEMFPTRFLTGFDLGGRVVMVTIAAIKPEEMRDPRTFEDVTRFVVYFKGSKTGKGLILNKTVARQIAAILKDDETNNWIGKQIALFPEDIKVAGEDHIAIRAQAVHP